MISTSDLASMRTAINSLLPDTCNILSLTRTSDGEGGWTETWGTATANVACRLDSQISRGVGQDNDEQVQNASLKPFSKWILTLPYGTAVTSANRVQIGSTQYSVVVPDSNKSWAVSVRVMVEKI